MQPVIAERRVALFGGAYSNWRALDAVLLDARRRGADAVAFLGDAGGFGAHPDRTIERLREAQLITVQGNYDDSVGNSREDCACGYTDPRDNRFAQISYDYTLANTSDESRRWLSGLSISRQVILGRHRIGLYHGSPRRTNEFLWESTTPLGFIRSLCLQEDVDLIACTHTGIPWERRLPDGKGLINVGAIGRPANDGRTSVWYTFLELQGDRVVTEFVPIEYDWRGLVEDMAAEGLPREFAETIATGWWTTCLEILPSRERFRGRF